MASQTTIRIGYVPEHYLLPLHLCKSKFPFPVELIPFPAGTGHMITSLRSDSIDLAIGLTEGWVAGLLTASTTPTANTPATRQEQDGGYSIVGSWVENPLRWSIVTGRNREHIDHVSDLAAKSSGRRVGVSRLGSGSHIMAFVLAQREGWVNQQSHEEKEQNSSGNEETEGLTFVPLGPFKDLRDGVSNPTAVEDSGAQGSQAKADFFMWEHFTTKPFFDGDSTPLKWIGEIYTPWPSWHIAASTKTFPNPTTDDKLSQIFDLFDQGVAAFNADPEEAVRLLGTGELGCHYNEEDAREWLKSVRFFDRTRGVDRATMDGVVTVLQGAGVIRSTTEIQDVDGVIGIKRTG